MALEKTMAVIRAAGRLRAAAALSLLVLLTGCFETRITRVSDGAELTHAQLLEDAGSADIIFVGEAHNSKFHHRAQLEMIKALREKGREVVVGVEMFRNENQSVLDGWIKGDMAEDEFKAAYMKNWGLPWHQYRDIFVYARENEVPMAALNVSRKLISQVVRKGFESLTPEELKELPPGVECRVDKDYEEFIREAMSEHSIDGTSFKRFCEAQMVWDNAMAHNAIEFLKKRPGSTMVLLAGSGHSWKRGIPAQVARLSGYSSVVILPESETFSEDEIGTDDADYVVAWSFF